MRRYLSTLIIVVCMPTAFAFAGEEAENGKASVRFAYDLDFEMRFDNREYSQSGYSKSMTIVGARLSPYAGVAVTQGNGMVHKVMTGIDIMKDFGASSVPATLPGADEAGEASSALDNWNLFREISLYYRLEHKIGKTGLSLTAGIFPRRFSQGEWPTSFFSDAVMFYDTNLEGLLLTFCRPNARYELGCDWMGMTGTARREKFMIFSDGEARLFPFMNIGYFAYLYHFANSGNVRGVVDNALVNPYIRFDFAGYADFQKLGVSLGYLQAYQNDRKNVGKAVLPKGGELTADVRNWNVGLEYRLFYGEDMMPYYNSTDDGGIIYGDRLYWGDPFYRVRQDGAPGVYQRLEVYYEPHIAEFVTLKVGAVMHFNEGFSGWQQMLSVRFSLDALMRTLDKK